MGNKYYGGSGGLGTANEHYAHGKKKLFSFGDRVNKHSNKLNKDEIEEYYSGSKMECFECGMLFKTLGRHIHHSHTITKQEYKEKYGLPLERALMVNDTKELIGRNSVESADTRREVLVECTCSDCGDIFKATLLQTQSGLYKSRCNVCYKKHMSKLSIKSMIKHGRTTNCDECGKEYKMLKANTKNKHNFCSVKCNTVFYGKKRLGTGNGRTMFDVICGVCKSKFQTHNKKAKFCCRDCCSIHYKNSGQASKNGRVAGLKRANSERDNLGRFK